MSLRAHLDRYCMGRAMANEHISATPRSRSPPLDRNATSTPPSPFFRPPGWQPPVPQAHRPVILQIDLKPMQQLAVTISFLLKLRATYRQLNMMASFRYTRLSTPDYASHHYIEEIETLVVTTFGQRWAIFLNSTDFCLTVDNLSRTPPTQSTASQHP